MRDEVIFRKWKSKKRGDIFAIFPYDIGDIDGSVMCVDEVNGSWDGEYYYLLRLSVPAKKNEYKELKRYIREIYMTIAVPVKQRNYDHYLEELDKVRFCRGC